MSFSRVSEPLSAKCPGLDGWFDGLHHLLLCLGVFILLDRTENEWSGKAAFWLLFWQTGAGGVDKQPVARPPTSSNLYSAFLVILFFDTAGKVPGKRQSQNKDFWTSETLRKSSKYMWCLSGSDVWVDLEAAARRKFNALR